MIIHNKAPAKAYFSSLDGLHCAKSTIHNEIKNPTIPINATISKAKIDSVMVLARLSMNLLVVVISSPGPVDLKAASLQYPLGA